MPQLGVSVVEGTIIAWHKQAGDAVEADEAVCDVASDKVDSEIPAPCRGRLVEVLADEGDTVPVGTVIATMEADSALAEPAPATHAALVEPAPATQAALAEPAPATQAALTEPAPATQAALTEPGRDTQAALADSRPRPRNRRSPRPASEAAIVASAVSRRAETAPLPGRHAAGGRARRGSPDVAGHRP